MDIAVIHEEAITDAFGRLERFLQLNRGGQPQSSAFEAVEALGLSCGLDGEGRALVVQLYRQLQPEQRRKAGAVLIGFMLGLMARQEADGLDRLFGEGVTDEALAEWLS